MRTLVLCGDYHHAAETTRQGLEALGDCGFTFDWLYEASEWSAEKMAAYRLVVFGKANHASPDDQSPWATPDVETAFQTYVQQGNSLLVLHSGTALYDKTPVLRALIGGVFESHPPQCPVTVEPHVGHPLTEGSTAFTLKDEHYQMVVDDPAVDHFLSTSSEHGTQPGGWTRTEGKGRVCVLTPGHNVEVWLHPSFQTLLLNALRWCAGANK